MKTALAITVVFLVVVGVILGWSQIRAGTVTITPPPLPQKNIEAIWESLRTAGHNPTRLELSPVKGIAAVDTESGQTLYVSTDGQYALMGDLIEISDGEVVNLTAKRMDKKRKDMLEELQLDDLIVFAPDGEVNHVVYVFTDVDCNYCRTMHQSIDEYLALGIELRYLAFPRSGTRSDTHDKMVSAWCAEDRKAALTALKNGASIDKEICPNPVANHYDLGLKMKIRGTPNIVHAATGFTVPGYLPAVRLAEELARQEP